MSETGENCKCPLSLLFAKRMSLRGGHLLFWSVFVAGLVADLWTKSAVFKWLDSLAPQRYGVIDGFFQLVLVENSGAAWGIAANRTIPLIIISVIAIIAVLAFFLFVREQQMVVVFSLALMTAGICGNLYDRVFNDGRVRDFLDFYYNDWHFPAFNIADSMLTVAVFFLIISTLFNGKESKAVSSEQ
ncbi:MAG: signal peptidase II [Phycisphaerae bacterium]|nr:signal peptidase II [Phycisphaerae bacterium]